MRQDVCEAEHAYNYREPQYRALPGAGGTWWQISYANIDQQPAQ